MITSLISISSFADAGLETTYDCDEVIISNNGIGILSGLRDPTTGLWMIDLDQPAPLSMLSVQYLPDTHQRLVEHIHRCWGNPANSTFIAAVKAGYIKVPGLTAEMARKYCPDSIATAKGHLDMSPRYS
jgi:hypothetical protein